MATLTKIEKTLGSNAHSGKTVAIAGLGSVGSHIAESLARLDIKLRMVDMGRIEPGDFETCSLYEKEEESKFKAKQAKAHLERIKPKAKVKGFHEQLKEGNIFLLESDLVIDCTQNWEVSKMINSFCKEKKIPLVYTKVAGAEGMVLLARNGYPYTKLEPKVEKLGNVKKKGLIPNTVHMAAGIAIAKALKILSDDKYSDKLFTFDAYKLSKKESKL